MHGIQILMFCDNTVLRLTLHAQKNGSIKRCNLQQIILIKLCCLWITWQLNKLPTFNGQLQSRGSCVVWFKNATELMQKNIVLGKSKIIFGKNRISSDVLPSYEIPSPISHTHKVVYTVLMDLKDISVFWWRKESTK